MTKRKDYVYERNLDVMIFGRVKQGTLGNVRNDFNVLSGGAELFYEFGEDANLLQAYPMGGYSRHDVQRIRLVDNPNRVTGKIPANVRYIQLLVRSESIYDAKPMHKQPQVEECMRWLVQNQGPSKIRINCHGAPDGKLYMGDYADSLMKVEGLPGEKVSDWLFYHGLQGPTAILVDARQSGKWQSKSNTIGCTACHRPFLHNEKKTHCRACGEVVHSTCLEKKHIFGALKSSTVGRFFSFSDRGTGITIDYACTKCIANSQNSFYRPRGDDRHSQETLEERQLYSGVVNIGLWVCSGGVYQDGRKVPSARVGRNDTAQENSIADKIAKRLRDRNILGIEITGRTDTSYQTQIKNPDGSMSPYFRLGQDLTNSKGKVTEKAAIVKRRIFT
jgi:hypothetical protein